MCKSRLAQPLQSLRTDRRVKLCLYLKLIIADGWKRGFKRVTLFQFQGLKNILLHCTPVRNGRRLLTPSGAAQCEYVQVRCGTALRYNRVNFVHLMYSAVTPYRYILSLLDLHSRLLFCAQYLSFLCKSFNNSSAP